MLECSIAQTVHSSKEARQWTISPSSTPTPITSMAPAYKNYLPEKFRARSGPYFPSFGWDIFLNGTTGRKPANPEEYCKDLDVEKIGDAVAYPEQRPAIGLVRELDLATELAKAYNDWAADFCQESGNRVKYAAVIAPQVISEAVKEVAARCHRKRRCRRDDADLRTVRGWT